MTLPASGQSVSFSQIRAEIRNGSNNPTYLPTPSPVGIPLGDANIRQFAFNPGPIGLTTARSLSQTRGVTFQYLNITTPTSTYNVRNAMIAAGWPSSVRGTANVNISATADIYTPSVSNFALTTGSPWPASSGARIGVVSGGSLIGKGGSGGDGGQAYGPAGVPNAQWAAGQPGTGGGAAMNITIPTTIVNAGTIGGGGGGGGGGNGRRVAPAPAASGGGGGGGGRTSAQGGLSGAGAGGQALQATVPQPGQAGDQGSYITAGLGGQNTPQPAATRAGVGGAGGGYGAAGTNGTNGGFPGTQGPGFGTGGAAGSSVAGYSLVTLQNTGSFLGPTSP